MCCVSIPWSVFVFNTYQLVHINRSTFCKKKQYFILFTDGYLRCSISLTKLHQLRPNWNSLSIVRHDESNKIEEDNNRTFVQTCVNRSWSRWIINHKSNFKINNAITNMGGNMYACALTHARCYSLLIELFTFCSKVNSTAVTWLFILQYDIRVCWMVE